MPGWRGCIRTSVLECQAFMTVAAGEEVQEIRVTKKGSADCVSAC